VPQESRDDLHYSLLAKTLDIQAYKPTWLARNGVRNLRRSQALSDLITVNEYIKHE